MLDETRGVETETRGVETEPTSETRGKLQNVLDETSESELQEKLKEIQEELKETRKKLAKIQKELKELRTLFLKEEGDIQLTYNERNFDEKSKEALRHYF